MKKNIKIVIMSLALALTVFFCLMAVENRMMKKYEQAQVLIATKEICSGTTLTDSIIKQSFKKVKVTKNLEIPSAVKDAEKLKGKTAVCDIAEGAVIYDGEFAVEEDAAGVTDPVEISVAVSTFSDGVSGTLRKGDFIYVYGTDNTGRTSMIGHGSYYIKDAFTSSGEKINPGDEKSVASVFTIITGQEEYEDICRNLETSNGIMLVKTDKKTWQEDGMEVTDTKSEE